jgi:hypothetical protein
MNYLRTNEDLPSQAYLQQFVVSPLTAWGAQAYNSFYNGNAALRGMDMTLGYNTVAQWNSDKVKQLMFHELSHASHYSRVGQSWWNSFVYSEAYAIFANGINSPNSPYGTGNDGLISDYISLGESWAEHLGRTIADRGYGLNSTGFTGQRSVFYTNNDPVPGLSSHLNYLEDFDPNNINNPFRWIPDGIYYDLFDTRNETTFPLIDGVSGFTNQQMFNALQSDIKSLPDFRNRLLQQNANNQATQVTNLFAQYHY